MPKEAIRAADYQYVPAPEGEVGFPPDCRLGQVLVGWSRRGYVEVGTTDESLRAAFFAPMTDLLDAAIIDADDLHAAAATMTASWPEFGVFLTLDRSGVNRLIRVLRTARDAAFGRDE